MRAPHPEQPILSRMIDITRLPDRGTDVTIKADSAVCKALAALNGLEAVRDFAAVLHVQKRGPSGAQVTGTVEAVVTQICVVSLDPFDTQVSERVDIAYESDGAAGQSGADVIAFGERDPPDPIVNGRIDVGALAAEFLSLSLDPYPKKPDVTFADAALDAAPQDPSPFAVLGRLKGLP